MPSRRVLSIIFSGAVKPTKELEVVFNLAPDWYRLNAWAWLVETDESVTVWTERLRPHLLESGKVFIAEVNMQTRWGLHSNDFWEWTDK